MTQTRIVAISLVRNEDVYIERVLRNIADFADEVIVTDNQSTDNTWPIVNELAGEYDKLRCMRIRDPGESQLVLQHYVGTPTWVFGVDGDEVYDPAGLARLRTRLLAGEFDPWWAVFGNVLNCSYLDVANGRAKGFLSPPSRSMTKLYNFNAIDQWRGPWVERLHGGSLVFRDGYSETLRCDLHKSVSWDEADYRCLHLCFLRRSTLDPEGCGVRPNIMELTDRRFYERWLGRKLWQRLFHRTQWKNEKYKRGAEVEIDVTPFFR